MKRLSLSSRPTVSFYIINGYVRKQKWFSCDAQNFSWGTWHIVGSNGPTRYINEQWQWVKHLPKIGPLGISSHSISNSSYEIRQLELSNGADFWWILISSLSMHLGFFFCKNIFLPFKLSVNYIPNFVLSPLAVTKRKFDALVLIFFSDCSCISGKDPKHWMYFNY